MVPWKSSFYLKPWVSKGSFVYGLQKRRVMGHVHCASTCCSTAPRQNDSPGVRIRHIYLPNTSWSDNSSRNAQESGGTGFCELLLIPMWWSLKETVFKNPVQFFMFFVGLAFSLFAFQVLWVFYASLFFCVSLAQAQLPCTSPSVWRLGNVIPFCNELHSWFSCRNITRAVNTTGFVGLIFGQGGTTGSKKSDL